MSKMQFHYYGSTLSLLVLAMWLTGCGDRVESTSDSTAMSYEDDRFNDADLNKFFKQHEATRQKLLDMRDAQIRDFFAEGEKESPNYFALAERVTDETKQFVVGLMQEATEQLPFFDQDNMAFVAAGSLARRDSGFYTDIEGFLLQPEDKPINQHNGKMWAQFVSDLLFGLQEHPDIGVFGLRLDEADSSPFHHRFFARNYTPGQALCSVVKSLGGTKTVLSGKSLGALDKRFYERYYPFEGTWANLTTPDKLVQYLLAFEKGIVPFVTESFPETPAGGWTPQNPEPSWPLWVAHEGLLNRAEINSATIKSRLATGECAKELNDYEKSTLADAVEKRMLATELSVLGKGPYNLRHQTLMTGSEGLYNYFLSKKAEILTKERSEELVKKMTAYLLDSIRNTEESALVTLDGVLPPAIDIKRTFFRLFEQFATNMGLRNMTDKTGQVENLDALLAMGILGNDFYTRLKDEMNFLTGVRLHQLAVFGAQLVKTYTSQERYDQENAKFIAQLEKMEKDLANAKTRGTLTPKMQANYVDMKRRVEAMKKLNPSNDVAILTEKQIERLKSKTLPLMNELYKRWVAYEGFTYTNTEDANGKVISSVKNAEDTPNLQAFQDDFDFASFDLKSVGMVPVKK